MTDEQKKGADQAPFFIDKNRSLFNRRRFTVKIDFTFCKTGPKRCRVFVYDFFIVFQSGFCIVQHFFVYGNEFAQEFSREIKPGEFAVLKAFARHPRVPLSREKLMEMARGREYEAFDRSLDVQISRLRKLVEPDPSKPRYIQTVWGLGYVFIPDGQS